MPRKLSFASRFSVALPVVAVVGLVVPWSSFMAPSPAAAQQLDLQALQQRVQRLESDLSILQRQVYTGGGGGSPSSAPAPRPAAPAGGGAIEPTVAASFEVRISQLEDEMQSLTGRIEEIGHNTDMLKSELDRLQKDIDFRLTALEKGGTPVGGAGGASANANSQTEPGAGAQEETPPKGTGKMSLGPGQVLPVGTSQQQYDYARALLIQQDYPGAEKAFSAFVNAHPDDKLAGPAQYWLGETFYVRGNYDQSAKAFAEGYQRYPKSDKAPDTLLKLGMSLAQLKRTKDACVLYKELETKYPSAPASVKQAAQRERQKSGCA
ncbi:MAG TPA: tol-pal system protein YbgF [Alphaproteobacteria bacterium]|nr:tol-pal system protein YbgF [Alphaproteobacteria bacterium]